MNEPERPEGVFVRLPREPVHRLRNLFARFMQIEAAGGAILLLFTAAAILLSNSQWAQPFEEIWETPVGIHRGELEFSRPLREWINDGLMTLFFFLVALELKRELVLGELRHPRTAALSIAGALGGMLVPAAMYSLLQWGGPAQHGWGTVMATDTAFVVGCLALLGSRVHPSLRLFMISLAIVDDIGAVLVVAVGYSSRISWIPLVFAAFGVVIVRTLAILGVRAVPFYFFLGGLIWLAVDASGVHATIAGVTLGLLTPARRWVADDRLYSILDQVVAHPACDEGSGPTRDRQTLLAAEIAVRESLSPLERLEIELHPWVSFIVMPLFALANAGFPLSSGSLTDSVTAAVLVGFVLGKPLGVFTFAWMAVRSGVAVRPAGLSTGMLAGGSLLAGVGFTMSLFIADLAFSESQIGNAKLGILSASIASAIAGLSVLMGLSVFKRRRNRSNVDSYKA